MRGIPLHQILGQKSRNGGMTVRGPASTIGPIPSCGKERRTKMTAVELRRKLRGFGGETSVLVKVASSNATR